MLESKIESLLFAAAKPLTVKKLAEFLDVTPKEVEAALETIVARLHTDASGLRLVRTGTEVQMMTSPENAKLIRDFLKDETSGELTKPQLETLTVIAYRQPITKAELEQIRGVNCSLILRNLLMRGLIEVEEIKEKPMPVYRVTHDLLRFLGITDVRELPDFESLHADEHIARVLEQSAPASESV